MLRRGAHPRVPILPPTVTHSYSLKIHPEENVIKFQEAMADGLLPLVT